jgi:hypothetical protein
LDTSTFAAHAVNRGSTFCLSLPKQAKGGKAMSKLTDNLLVVG